MTMITPVILCGGSGTRLWPRSRKTLPKPFLPLVGDDTLFEAALRRCPAGAGFAPPVVVTGAAHLAHVEAQLGPAAAGAQVIIEPEAKNTAAAIALAALRLPEDAVMLVCPSDHHIGDVAAFQKAACAAADLAAQGWLVALGIDPTAPETGYGYLHRGEAIEQSGGWRVARFVEKPDLERARAFLADGGFSWNGGIFAFRAGTFLEELAAHRPGIAEAVHLAVDNGRADGHRFHPDPDAFGRIEGESVDYAVMENTARAAMVPAAMAWSDIGNWQALHEALDRDHAGNALRGTVELRDCSNVLVHTDGPRVSVIGASNLIIVVDGDEVLVCTPEGAQLVGKLDRSRQPVNVLPIREVEKVWGRDTLPAPFEAPEGKRIGEIWFESPPQLSRLLVKYIFTSQALSVQVHPTDEQAKAAGETDSGKEECWLIVDADPDAKLAIGFKAPITAEAMRTAALDGSIEDLLAWHEAKPGDFFYIPAGTVHAIGGGLSLIEIQQNSDITYRLYDYGRPRELHLDKGIAVAKGEPYPDSEHRHIPDSGTVELARGRYFTAHRVEGEPDAALRAEYDCPLLVIPRAGAIRIHGDRVRPGECAAAPSLDAVEFDEDALAVIVRPA